MDNISFIQKLENLDYKYYKLRIIYMTRFPERTRTKARAPIYGLSDRLLPFTETRRGVNG